MPSGPKGDTGSIPFALLITIAGLSLSALLVPMVLRQVESTRVDVRRVESLHAAQAGMDVALAQIRAASTGVDGEGQPIGDITKLPCTTAPGSPLVGHPGSGVPYRYRVSVNYFTFDPRPADYLNSADPDWIANNDMGCPTTQPSYALIRAQGSSGAAIDDDGCANIRCLRAVYTVNLTNAPTAGGLIHTFDSSPDMCWDAGPPPWLAGAPLKTERCVPGRPQQTWAYTRELNLVLPASKVFGEPAMCVDTDGPHAPDVLVVLHRCLSPAAPRQRWSAAGRFTATAPNNVDLDPYCINVANHNTVGSLLRLGPCATINRWMDLFGPESSVGAGAAGQSGTDQIVNFEQFGRCIDLPWSGTDEQIYMTAYPCKQWPDPEDIEENQQWVLDPPAPPGAAQATGQLRSLVSIQRNQDEPPPYCMVYGATYAYVDAEPCAAIPQMTWTVYRDTGNYATGYRIMAGAPTGTPPVYGNCLAAKANAEGDFHGLAYETSKLVVAPCNDSTLQKWNAPPSILSDALKNVGER